MVAVGATPRANRRAPDRPRQPVAPQHRVRPPPETLEHVASQDTATVPKELALKMTTRSHYLASLTPAAREALEARLLDRQSAKCFICDDAIYPVLHQGKVDVGHIVPLAEHGPDDDQNLAVFI